MILTHTYGIWKDGTDEPIFRAVMDTQTQGTDLWTRGRGRSEWGELRECSTERHAFRNVRRMAGGNLLHDPGSSNALLCGSLGGGAGGKVGGGSIGGIYVYL